MPGWAIALAVALAATSAAIFAIVLTVEYQNGYRSDVYKNCVANKAGAARVIKVLRKLHDADQLILTKSVDVVPTTEFGQIDRAGIQQRVDAYSDLLKQTDQTTAFDCSTLR